jgi:hypothetical protein
MGPLYFPPSAFLHAQSLAARTRAADLLCALREMLAAFFHTDGARKTVDT